MEGKEIFTGNDAFLAKIRFPDQLENDADYKKMYLTLFNGITYALSQIDRMNFGRARDILVDSQKKAEDIFIGCEEELCLE